MIEDIKVAYYQRFPHWEDKQRNFLDIEAELNIVLTGAGVDLLVLSEAFATGFTDNIKEVSEPVEGCTFQWMKTIAAKYNTTVVGSVFVKEQDDVVNRMYWVKPEGEWGFYDKRHLFRLGTTEHELVTAGKDKGIFEVKGWKIRPFICYDLRFPVWFRNKYSVDGGFEYDLALVVASWPSKRVRVWQKLLEARAIENMCYVVGVNRIGEDVKEIKFSGASEVVNYNGEAVDMIPENEEKLSIATLSYEKLMVYRDRMSFHLDWDEYSM